MNNTRDQAARTRQLREVTIRATDLVLDYLDDVGPAQRAVQEQLVEAVACDCRARMSGYLGADAAMVAERCLQQLRSRTQEVAGRI